MQFLDLEASASDSSEAPNSQPSQQELISRPYRVNRKRFLLTYAQFNEAPENLLAQLNDIRPLHKGIACLELHEDGSPHCHAAVEFVAKVNSTNARIFDIAGHHPNDAGPPESWAACVRYCDDIDAIEVAHWGATSTDGVIQGSGGGGPAQAGFSNVFDTCERCESFAQWVQICIDRRLAFAYCNAVWNAVHAAPSPTFTENEPLPAAVTHPELRALVWRDHNRALVICGPSGVGKTTWALANAPAPFLLVTHLDDLKRYDARVHKSIVFDEIRCTGTRDEHGRRKGQWPLTEQIKLLTWDTPVSIHTRYVVASLPRHVNKIFTCTNTVCFTRDTQTSRRMRLWNLYNQEGDMRDDDDLWEEV